MNKPAIRLMLQVTLSSTKVQNVCIGLWSCGASLVIITVLHRRCLGSYSWVLQLVAERGGRPSMTGLRSWYWCCYAAGFVGFTLAGAPRFFCGEERSCEFRLFFFFPALTVLMCMHFNAVK